MESYQKKLVIKPGLPRLYMNDPKDRPPLFSTWGQWYVLVVVFLVILIILFYLFTKTFS